MTRRVRALWLPAVAVTLVAEAALYLVMRTGYRPWTIPLDWYVFHAQHHPLQFFVPWLLALPFVAAAGATWSRRLGGTPREAALAAMFPAIAALGLAIIATPLDILVDVVIRRSHALEHTFCGTAWGLVSFVLAPGIALALGLLVVAVSWHRAPAAGPRADGSRPSVKA
jgi:hypothetical protein